MELTLRRGEMDVRGSRRLRLTLQLATVVAIVSTGFAAIWFGFAAADASGVQMAAASGMFAAVASGWSGAFAATMAKLKSDETAQA
ncbi:hypothetical protein J2Y69_003203 [Microbacterium resistens]|uniref:Uncharacterized protein n=1 Tax=Microbacterium resistens TaxID=156977 RepID=A0ABU1SG40_9MICO|nr:hypothetical protein [Microbacterium resistens]MDR6868584.1 hypothetical protein [Microbacterium resistens]